MESTSIYFIGSVELGAVKVGKSINPEKRLKELQTGNAHKLVLYSVITDVDEDYEKRLHRILAPIRQKGEWFKMTDELIHFMINKTDETSYDFKISNGFKTNPDPLDIAIDKIVKPTKNGRGWVNEIDVVRVIRRFLILNDESPHFDVKKLRQKLKKRDIYGNKSGQEWIYRDHYADETEIQPSHYVGPETIFNENEIDRWNTEWGMESRFDSRDWKNVKVSIGYSYITSYKDGSLTVSTITTTAPGIEHDVVIYKRGVYDARGIG